jgi:hypothetical protein
VNTRHAVVLVCVLACARTVSPAPSPLSRILAGPAISAESLRVAATDSFGVALAQRLAPGANVRVVSDRAALDLIDGGGDVLVTDRPTVIRYASSRSDFATIPLPWDREYILVTAVPTRVPDVIDAVHAEARPAPPRCPVDSTRAQARRVVYIADDSLARSLAERLVGLGTALRAVPLTPPAFERALSEGTEPAYIVARAVDNHGCEVGPLRVAPLIETRSQLIVRRGAVGVVADTAGSMRLETTP